MVSCDALKQQVQELHINRGKPESSILADIKHMLNQELHIKHGAYHGGDVNRVCCQRIVSNAEKVAKAVKMSVLAKKDESCSNVDAT